MPERRRRWSLAVQIGAVTTLVTVVAVVVTFLVSARLIRGAAESEARTTLGHYADLAAGGPLGVGGPGQPVDRVGPGVRALFQVSRIVPLLVRPGGEVIGRAPGPVPADVVAAAARGEPVDRTVTVGGDRYFAEARQLPPGGSVLLLQPTSATSQLTTPLRSRVVSALLIGLAVAVAAGWVLSRRLARPLVHAAGAATRLAHGQRGVRLEPEGPTEVAAVADSINELATALASSEKRQREFLLSVSHELRTPLTAIVGYAEALADAVVPPGEAAAAGATMLAEAQRLHRLVDDLLDLARIGADEFPIEPAPVDLVALLAAAGEVWSARCAREGVRLAVEVPDEALTVTTDAGRVRQIIDGLAENALRVTPAGAQVVLAARRVDGSGVDGHGVDGHGVDGHGDVGGVEVEVRDGGPGLSDDDLAVAFERSALHDRYRGERRVGSGIGLALIARLADRLGGRAEAGHAPEGGARFTVSLPVAPRGR